MRYEIELNQAKATSFTKKIFRKIAKDFKSQAEKTLIREVAIAFSESQSEVPVLTGTLKRSGYHTVDLGVGKATIGYVDQGHDLYNSKSNAMTSQYFRKIHEDLTLNHPNGKAKFLEDPCSRLNQRLNEEFKMIVKGM